MSMEHKAFKFDFKEFEKELKPILTKALVTGENTQLIKFIEENVDHCTYPWAAEPLSDNWEQELEIGDVHEIGDFALTKYYDPDHEKGLASKYIEISERYPALSKHLLGIPLGQNENYFDPGKMGSYFVSPDEALRLGSMIENHEEDVVKTYGNFLIECANAGLGVYITF